jgi:hypothetical protein
MVHPGPPSSSTSSGAPASLPNISTAHRGGMPSHLAKCSGVAGPYAYSHLAAPVRAEAQHPAVRGGTRELAPARPHALERLHRPLDGPRAGTIRDRLGQLINTQLRVRQRAADGRDDLVRLPGGEADPLRWMVPRGPNALTRARSSQSARCTSPRVAPAMRRPMMLSGGPRAGSAPGFRRLPRAARSPASGRAGSVRPVPAG